MSLHELVFEPAYDEACSEYESIERFDDMLRGIYWGLATNPTTYDIAFGMEQVRILKTRPINSFPAFIIWFKIAPDEKVHLLAIEPA